jgi:hypothetical protein
MLRAKSPAVVNGIVVLSRLHCGHAGRAPGMTIQIKRPKTYEDLALGWMNEIHDGLPDDFEGDDMGYFVSEMNFLAAPEAQWAFLRRCIDLAWTDDQLGHIAAGPFEHLLGFHGADFIDRVEAEAAANPKFGRMTLGSWRHMMTDDVWSRVQAIQARAEPSE